jgi:protein TonB
MSHHYQAPARSWIRWRTTVCLGLAAIVASCATKPPPQATAPQSTAPVAPPTAVVRPPALPEPVLSSQAPTPRDYRRDAAAHLYARNMDRIYAGKLPPLLYAVGVLQVDIDRMGHVTDIRWMRAPTQAPEVMAEIERSVRQAAPFPAPVRMGRVTYTDTWLWHKSGRFQLDTLTEGQL